MNGRIIVPLEYPEGFNELLQMIGVDTSNTLFYFQVEFEDGRKGTIIAFNMDGSITKISRGSVLVRCRDCMMWELRVSLGNIDVDHVNEKILGNKRMFAR